jgi:hypothetical protein
VGDLSAEGVEVRGAQPWGRSRSTTVGVAARMVSGTAVATRKWSQGRRRRGQRPPGATGKHSDGDGAGCRAAAWGGTASSFERGGAGRRARTRGALVTATVAL